MKQLIPILLTVILLFAAHSAFSQGIWKTYTRADGLAGDTVGSIIQDKFGNYWFTALFAGLSKLDTNGVWSTFMAGDSLAVSNTVIDSLNNKWLRVTQLGGHYYGDYVVKFDDSSFTYYSPTGHPEPVYEPHLSGLGKDAAGHIWCGTQDKLAYWFDGTEWHEHYVPGTWGEYAWISDIKPDRNGTLYFAHKRGISTLDEYVFGDLWLMTFSLAFDRQNRMWLGSYSNKYPLGMFDGENWHGFTTADGLKQNDVTCVAVDSSNNIWIDYASAPGVSKFDGYTFTHFTQEDGLAHNRVASIYVDKKGYIWFATRGGVSVLKDTTTSIKEKFVPNYQSIKFTLFQNYPNPFNTITVIKYTLINEDKVELSLYNLIGKEVINLVNEQQTAGLHQVIWDSKDYEGKEVSSGIYIAVFKSGNIKKTIKLILTR